jgi:prenyltransferase beta subunit
MSRWSLVCLIAVGTMTPAHAQSADDSKATIAYLQALQLPDGGFSPSRPFKDAAGEPSLRATSAAVRALKYLGAKARDEGAAAKFVQRCFVPTTGGFADQPGGRPDVTLTAVGLMAVVELKLPIELCRDPAVKYLAQNAKSFEDIRIAVAGLEALGIRSSATEAWLAEIAKTRNPDGAYGKGPGSARATGSAAVAVLRLGGKVEHKDRVLQALTTGQRSDGGFGREEAGGSDLETTYRVMRAFMMLKEQPADIRRLREFVARCRNADGGYGAMPGQPSAVGPTYFAAIIYHWLGER